MANSDNLAKARAAKAAKRAAQQAQSEVGPSFLADTGNALDDNDVFIAGLNLGNDGLGPLEATEIDDEGSGLSSGGNAWSRRPGTITMYKPTERGYFPRTVTKASAPQLLAEGWLPRCPDCGGTHDAGVNVCPGKEDVQLRICPVCSKKIPDNSPFVAAFDDDDPNVIRDEAYESSTPASRTKAQLDLHLWTRHPQEARSMNIAPLPEMPQTVMQSVVGSDSLAGPVQGGQ